MSSKIEWLKTDGRPGYSLNPVKGLCPVRCSYCYARRMYQRFEWNPEIRFDWSVANDVSKIKKPSKIFVGSTMELFGPWIKPEWMRLILELPKQHPQHTFIFLTKRPWELAQYVWPENCWVGASATNRSSFSDSVYYLNNVYAKVKFISMEPLLSQVSPAVIPLEGAFIKWIIIGAQTPLNEKTNPKREWIDEIVCAADHAGCAVFEKDNLQPLLGKLRQEWPV